MGVVVGAWVVSRALAAAALCVLGSHPRGHLDLSALTAWDSNWYLRIMRHGYGPTTLPTPWHVGPPFWTTWPFFPLHPALARVLTVVGVPDRAALVVVNNLAFLVALAGIHRITRRHLGARTAAHAVWAAALFPGSITAVMGYSGGLFLAGSVWAFALAEDDRFAVAGLCAAVAVAARPNGVLLLVALVPAVIVARRRQAPGGGPSAVRAVGLVAGPALAFFAAWCAWCYQRTGDALVFLHAKQAWEEVTLADFVRHPLAGNSTIHVFLAVIAVVALVWQRRRLPLSWLALVALLVVPSLVLGVVGLGRYAIEAFPVSIALGALAANVPRWLGRIYFGLSAGGLVVFGSFVMHAGYVP
jgi:hypothetical protein